MTTYALTDTPAGIMLTQNIRQPEQRSTAINVLCIDDADLLAVEEALRGKREEREAAKRPGIILCRVCRGVVCPQVGTICDACDEIEGDPRDAEARGRAPW